MTNEVFIEKLKNLNPKGQVTVQSEDGKFYDLTDVIKDDRIDKIVIKLGHFDKKYHDNVDINFNNATTDPHRSDVINKNAPADHFNQSAIDKGVNEQQKVLNEETPKMRTIPADDPASERSRVEASKNLPIEDAQKLQDLFKNDRPDKSGDKKREDRTEVGIPKSGHEYISKEDRKDALETDEEHSRHPNPAMESSLPTVAPGLAPAPAKDKYEQNPQSSKPHIHDKDTEDHKHHNKK